MDTLDCSDIDNNSISSITMIELPDSVLDNALKNNFKKHININNIISLINHTLSDSHRGLLLQFLLEEVNEYQPLAINDVITFIPERYELDAYGDLVTLTDTKLYANKEMVGIIVASDTYGDQFDPYCNKMKVESIGFVEKEFTIIKSSIHTNQIKRLNCVPTTTYFKDKYINLQDG